MVGGAAGVLCALLLVGAAILTSPEVQAPNAPTLLESVSLMVILGAIIGAIVGSLADVSQPADILHQERLERVKKLLNDDN
jgi:hypothetical protein